MTPNQIDVTFNNFPSDGLFSATHAYSHGHLLWREK